MKVLGIAESKGIDKRYICEIGHDEIRKFLDIHYNKMQILQIGETVDLGKGKDWHEDTQRAFEDIKDFISANKKIIQVIMDGFEGLGNLTEEKENN